MLCGNYPLRHSFGDTPMCSLKNLPRKLWLGKCMASVISLMLMELFFRSTQSSDMT